MIPDEEIAEIKKKLEEHDKRLSNLESLFQAKPEAIEKQISIKEFILSKKPKSDIQKTLAIAYYLERHKGLLSFNVKDLRGGFRNAREKVPENINVCVIKNIENGHMMETEEKKDKLKAWVLTNTGEEYVENDFEKEK
ncbi:MAG: hypothetical protein KAW83_01590 [Dehalococcoidia bacterium]|nr:hypothetical protein [Dehalococcoidia bacterium]